MAVRQGANPEELRALARAVAQQAGKLESGTAALTLMVLKAPWLGQDAERFRHDWGSRHRPELARLAELLRASATTITANAAAQERTSEAEHGPGPGSGGPSSGGRRDEKPSGPTVEELQKDVAVSVRRDTLELKASAKVPLEVLNVGGEESVKLVRETVVNADGTVTVSYKLVDQRGATVGVGHIGTVEANGGAKFQADGTFKLTFLDQAAADRYESALRERLAIDSFGEAAAAARNPLDYTSDALDHAARESGAKEEVLVKGTMTLTADGKIAQDGLGSVDARRDLAVSVQRNLTTGETTGTFKASGEFSAELGSGRFRGQGEAEAALKLTADNSVKSLDVTIKGQYQSGTGDTWGVSAAKATGGHEAVMKISMANTPQNRAIVEGYLASTASADLSSMKDGLAVLYRAGDVTVTTNQVTTAEGGYRQSFHDVLKASATVKHETSEATAIVRKLPGETTFTQVRPQENP